MLVSDRIAFRQFIILASVRGGASETDRRRREAFVKRIGLSPTDAASLNAALMFLPSHLARYVLVHELCHTAHLNHSSRYWALVARHYPEYRTAEREMRRGRDYISRWALTEERIDALA